jgi:hypothetical protein
MAHHLLFGCLLLEVLGLELLSAGVMHHVWDAAIILIYGYVAWRLSHSVAWGAVVLSIGAVAWGMDLTGSEWAGFDLESFLWTLAHAALAYLLRRWVFGVREITAIEIEDAVSLYILVAIAFANIYGMILWHEPGALTHVSIPPGENPEYSLVLYYSFITQLTVGYGDMLPASQLTRSLSILQSLFGVMYVAILISWFVAIHSANHVNRQKGD